MFGSSLSIATRHPASLSALLPAIMAPMKSMKAMKKAKSGGKAMTKGALVKILAEQHEMKTKACAEVLDSLAALATTEVKKTGIFTLPGLCRIKTRVKPARTVVKAFPVAALKAQI